MKLPDSITRALGNTTLLAKQNSPHILFVAGVMGVVGGALLACRATLKLDEALDDFKDEIAVAKAQEATRKEIKHFQGSGAELQHRSVALVYGKNTAKLVLLYAPAVGAMGLGIGLLTGSHVQLSRRNASLATAYAAMSTAYSNYRERVREEIGEEKERDIYYGVSKEIDPVTKAVVATTDPGKWSPYMKLFDNHNANFQRDVEMNRRFVLTQQQYANDLLDARGYVFLHEVYTALGFEHTKASKTVGWRKYGLTNGDGFIDFGIYAVANTDYANGWEPSLLLDFNVDGYILADVLEEF